MPKLITLGETMAVFTPGAQGALRYVADYRMRIAGAESNLAIGIAKLGGGAGWISGLGRDEFGYFVRNAIRAEGVDTSRVVFDDAYATGLMFKEMGAGETKVYYYRENSAASRLGPQHLDPEYFKDAQFLHLTGITPVLSESCRRLVTHAIELAKQYNLRISFDPNIRQKLWRNTDYTPLMRQLTLAAHIVLMGLDEAEILFGTQEPEAIFNLLFERGNAQRAAIKNGAEGSWVADKTMWQKIAPHPCKPVEPIGAGDAFNAGFLTGVMRGLDTETCGRMGNIAGAMATESPGDIEGYPDERQMQAALLGTAQAYR